MIRGSRMSTAGIASDAQGHGGHDDAVGAQPGYRDAERDPGDGQR
jgi:hypothetical protein